MTAPVHKPLGAKRHLCVYTSNVYFYIRQVNRVKLVDILFSSLLCVCLCDQVITRKHSNLTFSPPLPFFPPLPSCLISSLLPCLLPPPLSLPPTQALSLLSYTPFHIPCPFLTFCGDLCPFPSPIPSLPLHLLLLPSSPASYTNLLICPFHPLHSSPTLSFSAPSLLP